MRISLLRMITNLTFYAPRYILVTILCIPICDRRLINYHSQFDHISIEYKPKNLIQSNVQIRFKKFMAIKGINIENVCKNTIKNMMIMVL